MKLQRAYNSHTPASLRNGIALGTLCDDDGRQFFTTFEDKPIPAGTYVCKLLDHPKHGLAWEVCDVPERTGILFHIGNDEGDSEGCILVGLGFARNARAITLSASGYQRFRRFLSARDTFTLTIADPSV